MEKDKFIKDLEIKSVSIFKDNQKDLYIFQKIQRICSAIYLVSDLMIEGEPLRVGLRNSAVRMIELTSNVLYQVSLIDRQKNFEILSTVLLQTLSFINIAYVSSLTSEMNHDVLKKEFEETLGVIQAVHERKDEGSKDSRLSLSRSYFSVDIDQTYTTDYSKNEIQKVDFKTDEKNTPSSNSRNVRSTNSLAFPSLEKQNPSISTSIDKGHRGQFYKGHVKDIVSGEAFRTFDKGQSMDSVSKSQARQVQAKSPFESTFSHSADKANLIITMLRTQGPLTIKDFGEKITDCSTKTIQRLLNSMVMNGYIKRVGAKRWSKYSI